MTLIGNIAFLHKFKEVWRNKMIEDEIKSILEYIIGMNEQLNILQKHLIPEKKDYSKESEEVQKLVTDPKADASRTFCFRMDCKLRDIKRNRPKECMIGKCDSRIKKPTSQPTQM